MKRSRTLLLITVGLLLAVSVACADISITVDGSLTDWGVTPGSDYTPLSGVNSWIEPGIGSNGYVGPGYGGQDFNVEAMYSTVADGKLNFAVITGFSPEGQYANGHKYYPGDILIDFEPHYVPSGSTTPTGTINYAIETTTYSSTRRHGGEGAQGAGALFSNVTPGLARIEWDGVYYPYEIKREGSDHHALGTLESTPTDFIYAHWGGDHYVIEGAVSADVFFGPGTVGGLNGVISWTMSCANDIGFVSQTLQPQNVIPEPASLLLLVGSVAGALIRRRRK